MLSYCGVLVFAAILQVISSQDGPPPSFLDQIPEDCRRPPRNVKPQECCDLPPLLEESKLIACGIKKEGKQERRGFPDCTKSICLMRNENLLDDENKIKYPEMGSFLTNWGKDHPVFEQAIEYAKSECMKEGGPPGPHQICEPDRFLYCTAGAMYDKCPTWKESEDCQNLRNHMNKCQEFFKKAVF